MRGASAFAVVMDQTRAQSLVEGMEILEMAREHTQVPAVMVVNKCDLDTQWHWREKSVKKYADEFDASFYTSAKTGEQVNDMFKALATLSMST